MSNKVYKIKDLALRLDRSILTIKRWERHGLIPKARKDSRGWRIYTEAEVRDSLRLVQATNYFRNGSAVLEVKRWEGLSPLPTRKAGQARPPWLSILVQHLPSAG